MTSSSGLTQSSARDFGLFDVTAIGYGASSFPFILVSVLVNLEPVHGYLHNFFDVTAVFPDDQFLQGLISQEINLLSSINNVRYFNDMSRFLFCRKRNCAIIQAYLPVWDRTAVVARRFSLGSSW